MSGAEPDVLQWGELIERLRDAGVLLETTQLEYLTETGERATAQFLVRWVGGQPRYHVVEIASMTDPVPKFVPRRIAIALDLPPDRFIYPDADL